MPHAIFAELTASITELKKDPMGIVAAGEGQPVAILNRNQPAFYCVPAEVFRELMEIAEDQELARLVEERRDEEMIPVTLDEL